MSNARASSENILVVDDESTIRRLLVQMLTSNGYRCQEAPGAEQAMDCLKNNRISLVLLDIKMPGKTGIELLPEIIAGYPDTAVIMATATNDIDIAIQCMKQGASDYITKPFNFNDVLISIQRALDRRKLEIEVKGYRQHLEVKVNEQAEKIRTSFLNAVRALAYAQEAKDIYTSGHSQRVADISAAIAREMDLDEETIGKIILAALVHDIGKIGMRESVLNKPGPLTTEEFQHVQKHPEVGEHILSPIIADEDILNIIKNHHSYFNGDGYPSHLKGQTIPVGARILAVADAYEAMTSERPYRKAMTEETARKELLRCRGTQFDPDVVDAFLHCKRPLHPATSLGHKED